jgi:hypothetical protein
MFTGMGIRSGMSSAVRGLIPKSTGGRVALGGAILGGGIYGADRLNSRRIRNNTQQRSNEIFNDDFFNNRISLTEVTPQGKPIRTF